MSHTATPWFVAGVRVKMDRQEWLAISRYDESKKQDENIACVGYDPRTGLGTADAHFIVKSVNAHDDLVDALKSLIECKVAFDASDANQAEAYYKLVKYAYPAWEKAREALAKAGEL